MLQASCIRWHGRGILLIGEPGSGKSSLTVELLAAGAHLVADDAVSLTRRGDRLIASALPGALPGPGLIELRGSGIFSCVNGPATPIHRAVRLKRRDRGPRVPDEAAVSALGISLPTLSLVADGGPLAVRLLLATGARRVA